jgi:hypothetical protein
MIDPLEEVVCGVAMTTVVAEDDAVAEPAELLAVTERRSVEPTFADATRYVVPVAPAIGAHDAPAESQRCH